jgi:hypothetical protein
MSNPFNCITLSSTQKVSEGPLTNLSGERNGCVATRSVLKRIQAAVTAANEIKGLIDVIEGLLPDMNVDIAWRASCHTEDGSCQIYKVLL